MERCDLEDVDLLFQASCSVSPPTMIKRQETMFPGSERLRLLAIKIEDDDEDKESSIDYRQDIEPLYVTWYILCKKKMRFVMDQMVSTYDDWITNATKRKILISDWMTDREYIRLREQQHQQHKRQRLDSDSLMAPIELD